MTPLQELIASIWALLPGLIPYLFLVWAGAAFLAAASLAIDEYNGQPPARPMLSTALFALGAGIMFTLVVVANEARAKGLVSLGQFGIAAIAMFFGAISFSVSKSLKQRRPVRVPKR